MLEDAGHEVIYEERPFPAYSFEELQKLLPDVDAAIVGLDTYNEDVWKISDRLKGASKFGKNEIRNYLVHLFHLLWHHLKMRPKRRVIPYTPFPRAK